MAVGHIERSERTIAKRVFITGATGFAGSSLALYYAEQGWSVVGTYRDAREDRTWAPATLSLYPIDLRDRAALQELVAVTQPDVVHHLAAQSSVAVSLDDPMGTLIENSAMQHNLLEAVKLHSPAARVVVVGSSDEYGDVAPEENPVSEAHELRPATPYALSKVVQDLMGLQYAIAHGLHVVRARPFLQLGPRRPATFAVGSFARQIAEIEHGLRSVEVHVGNIDLVRDFTHVRDVARALSLLAERGAPGEVYNVASGTGHSLREVIEVMLQDTGIHAEIRQDPALLRAGETPLLVGDATRLREATGWTPEISFEEASRETLAYWRDQVRQAVSMRGER